MFLVFLFRYWLFSDVVPGLYIEKGWVHEGIDYNFTPPPEDKPAEPEVEEEEECEAAAQGKCFVFNTMLAPVCFVLLPT